MSEHIALVEARCEGCGLLYGGEAWADVVIPDEVWNSLNAGLLCFNCMTAALNRAGHKKVAVLVASGPYVCDSEKWRLLGWDHGRKVGRQEADDELIEAMRESIELLEGWINRYCHPRYRAEHTANLEKKRALLAKLAPKVAA